MRNQFLRSLGELNTRVVGMAALAEEALMRAMLALRERNVHIAQEVMDGDDAIDDMEVAIEHECVKLIALQQPIAQDLRLVTALLKMITDIERIADQAADICETMIADLADERLTIPGVIYEMGEFAAHMVHDAVHAYVMQDTEQASRVIDADERMDAWFEQATVQMCALFESGMQPGQVLHLAYVAKYLERVADHATNLAEWALYRIRGDKKPI